MKCALDEEQSNSGGIQAKTDFNGKVKTNSLNCAQSCSLPQAANQDADASGGFMGLAGESGSHALDFNRYCFYYCRPYDFTAGNMCVTISDELLNKTKGAADPALHPLVSDPAQMDAWARAIGAKPPVTEAPPTTTASLPCEESDPCAYKLMNASIKEAKEYYRLASNEAYEAARIARGMGEGMAGVA